MPKTTTNSKNTVFQCEYMRTSQGYTSGCGYRAAWNHFWHFCPYCGKIVYLMNRRYDDREEDKGE